MVGWDDIEHDLKTRFGLENNFQVAALIGGGHSVGRAHFRVTGHVGGWDISQDSIDNDYFKALINQDTSAMILGLKRLVSQCTTTNTTYIVCSVAITSKNN